MRDFDSQPGTEFAAFESRMENLACLIVAEMMGHGYRRTVQKANIINDETTDLNTNPNILNALIIEHPEATLQLVSLRDVLVTADEIDRSGLIRPPSSVHAFKEQMSLENLADRKIEFATPFARNLLYNIALGIAGTGVTAEVITGKSISNTIKQVRAEAMVLRKTPTVVGPRCTTGDVIFGVLTGRITLPLTQQSKRNEFLRKP